MSFLEAFLIKLKYFAYTVQDLFSFCKKGYFYPPAVGIRIKYPKWKVLKIIKRAKNVHYQAYLVVKQDKIKYTWLYLGKK
jgi:hypothetical protein